MMRLSKRNVLGPVLALGLLIALVGSAMPAAAAHIAPVKPEVQAVLHDNYTNVNPADLGMAVSQTPRYTLHVTGASFVPGARVDMALIDTAPLQFVQRGTAYAGTRYLNLGLGYDVPNPLASTFDYHGSFNSTSTTLRGGPHLWCRSTQHLDIHNVQMR